MHVRFKSKSKINLIKEVRPARNVSCVRAEGKERIKNFVTFSAFRSAAHGFFMRSYQKRYWGVAGLFLAHC